MFFSKYCINKVAIILSTVNIIGKINPYSKLIIPFRINCIFVEKNVNKTEATLEISGFIAIS